MRFAESKAARRILLLVFLVVAVLSIAFNTFRLTPSDWFRITFDSGNLILGTVMKGEADGVGRYPFLHGSVYDNPGNTTPAELFAQNRRPDSFVDYDSQIGVQGIFFELVDSLLPFPAATRLQLFYLINAILLALCLAVILAWLFETFGFAPCLATALAILLSPWITAMGHNLYWCIWLLYLPMSIGTIWLGRRARGREGTDWQWYLFTFLAVFLKSACGYEFISVVLVCVVVPHLYYVLARPEHRGVALRRGAIAAGAGVAGFFAALIVHSILLGARSGASMLDFGPIVQIVLKRTYSDPALWTGTSIYASQLASTMAVAVRYFQTPTMVIVAVFLVALVSAFIRRATTRRETIALFLAAVLSALGPLSWWVLAKAHSYIHLQINIGLWYVPFVLLAVASVTVFLSERGTRAGLATLLALMLAVSFAGDYAMESGSSRDILANIYRDVSLVIGKREIPIVVREAFTTGQGSERRFTLKIANAILVKSYVERARSVRAAGDTVGAAIIGHETVNEPLRGGYILLYLDRPYVTNTSALIMVCK